MIRLIAYSRSWSDKKDVDLESPYPKRILVTLSLLSLANSLWIISHKFEHSSSMSFELGIVFQFSVIAKFSYKIS